MMTPSIEPKPESHPDRPVGVRGRRPRELHLQADELAALQSLDNKLQNKDRMTLHPILWRIPLPKPESKHEWKLKELVSDQLCKGWSAKVAFVLGDGAPQVLTDVFALKLWLDSKKSVEAIPEDRKQIISKDEALVWHLQNNIAPDWSPERRAVAAAVMAGAVRDEFHALKAAAVACPDRKKKRKAKKEPKKKDPKKWGVNDILARLVPDISARHVSNALDLLRRSRKRFCRVLWGETKLMTVEYLSGSAKPGSRARSKLLLPAKYYARRFEYEDVVSLVIIDLELLAWNYCRPDHIDQAMQALGIVVILGQSALDRADEFIRDLNDARDSKGAPYRELGRGECLDAVPKKVPPRVDPQKMDENDKPRYRPALILGRDQSSEKEWSEADREVLRTHYESIKKNCSLVHPKDLQYPLDRRKARIRTYENLIAKYCLPDDGCVFAPCIADDNSSQHRIFLACMRSATHRSDRVLTFYHLKK